MKPTTLRLRENTLQALDREAEEYDFPNRTEYIRYILDNRSVVVENTRENTAENTPLVERVAELEERVEELEADREPSAKEAETPENSATPVRESRATSEGPTEISGQSDVDAILDDWPPRGTRKRDRRREVGRAALEWLRERDSPASGADFREALYEEYPVEGQSEETYWRKTVRPALQQAVEAGVVSYREGYHDYQWTGK